MRARLTPLQIGGGIVALLVVTLVILLLPSGRIPYTTGDYLLLPDIAHPVAPLVRVAGNPRSIDGGKLYFVDVREEQASELDVLFPSLHPHSTLIPAAELLPPGSSDSQFQHAELRQMAESQQIAGAVAERQLGLHVVAHLNGVLVDNTFADVPAASKIDPADIVIAANGKPTLTVAALHAALSPVKPGQTVVLRIRRGSQTLQERVGTVPDPKDPKRAFIGIVVEQSERITQLPVRVSIDAGNIGGPSAGLAFTLEVMERLGANVTHGYKVAATGTMSLNGTVGAIGGIEQKTWGVREAGAQVFLVPVAGDNARDARANAGPNLKIIPVTSLKQALHALAALPKLK